MAASTRSPRSWRSWASPAYWPRAAPRDQTEDSSIRGFLRPLDPGDDVRTPPARGRAERHDVDVVALDVSRGRGVPIRLVSIRVNDRVRIQPLSDPVGRLAHL